VPASQPQPVLLVSEFRQSVSVLVALVLVLVLVLVLLLVLLARAACRCGQRINGEKTSSGRPNGRHPPTPRKPEPQGAGVCPIPSRFCLKKHPDTRYKSLILKGKAGNLYGKFPTEFALPDDDCPDLFSGGMRPSPLCQGDV